MINCVYMSLEKKIDIGYNIEKTGEFQTEKYYQGERRILK